ncbi:hypothetical protein BJX66DRAFT_331452 [Aspergillus keveii]|uniref:Extracellular membrane protein CFEM domain-containing protein n=1 Tax=Aspergillus keveii TaxID=714993 RepID=A0ABR4GQD6_9EURO
MRSVTINLTLALFSLLTPTIHAQNFTTFHDYLSTYIPNCILDCTISAAERDTECGSGSVSSTDADDIDCLCDAFWHTNGRFVRDFSESMARCVTDARCSLDELEDVARVDPWTLFDGVDGLCGGSHGHDHNDDDDSNNSNDDDTSNSNNSNNSNSSSNSDDTQDSSSDTADDTSDSSTSSSSNSGDDDNGAASIASRSIAALAAGALVVLAAF